MAEPRQCRTLQIDPDIVAAYRGDESGLEGTPQAVFRPASEVDVVDCLREARARRWAVTPVGRRTNTVASAIVDGGAVLSTECMAGLLAIDRKRRVAVAEPGILLADFKRAVAAEGLFYPPDPTSEEECSLGGTIATNASGARTLKYGPTRRYVRSLRVVLANGERLTAVQRELAKNTAGYWPFHSPADVFVGSEGTLGVVTAIEVALLPAPLPFFGAFAFFPTLADALAFVMAARRSRRVAPRCLELFDSTALSILRGRGRGASGIPQRAEAAIFFEQETADEMRSLRLWSDLLERHRALTDATLVADTPDRQQGLREMRHLIPATLNEWARAHRPAGGRKVTMDFAVPPESLARLIAAVDEAARAAGVDLVVRYGHVGNGHPHIYTRGRDANEVQRLDRLTHELAALAVALGGTVAAEHGIGKTKRHLLSLMYPPAILRAMRGLKHTLDPEGLLAPGNVFPPGA